MYNNLNKFGICLSIDFLVLLDIYRCYLFHINAFREHCKAATKYCILKYVLVTDEVNESKFIVLSFKFSVSNIKSVVVFIKCHAELQELNMINILHVLTKHRNFHLTNIAGVHIHNIVYLFDSSF